MKMASNVPENKRAKMELKNLCKFQNIGYCKFKETCCFRHVQNVHKKKNLLKAELLSKKSKNVQVFSQE